MSGVVGVYAVLRRKHCAVFFCFCFTGQEVSLSGAQVQKSIPIATQLKQQEFLKQAQVLEQPFVPKDPPAEFEFVADPPSISALDL